MTSGTYDRLGLHVSASNRDVIRAARKVIARQHRRDPSKRAARKQFYRDMLREHERSIEVYHYVMRGLV